MATINLTANVISWWRMDEDSGNNVLDAIGSHNGVTVDDISTITSSNAPNGRDSSFYINGNTNKVIDVDDHADFSFGDGTTDSPFSFSIWADASNNNGIFFSKFKNSNLEYKCEKTVNLITCILYNNSGDAVRASFISSYFDDVGWHHFVFTYDGRGGNSAAVGIKAYIDGIEVPGSFTSNAAYEAMSDTSSDFVIGATSNIGRDRFFDGYMSDAILFDKDLTDGEVKYLYNDGDGIEQLSIITTIDTISSPTLLSPNGGETFTEGSINITWKEPSDLPTTDLTWYDIFITDDFNNTKKEELIQIATLPFGTSSYSYTLQKNLRGKKCRVGIRSVNHKGLRSKISFSADDFIIINEFLPSPVLLEPVEGNTYFSYIPFIFDHNGVLGRSSQRSFYQIYYKSDQLEIDWTLLKSNIMVGSDPINVDASNFTTNSDYVIKVELVDGDNVSAPVFIDNININNINLFIIDTTAPTGTIKIVDNEEYTKNKSLLLNLSSSDENTAVKDVKIWQTNTQNGNLTSSPNYLPLDSLITWDIKEEVDGKGVIDGVKLIQASFRDFANNSIEIGESISSQKFFRTYKNLDNRKVTAIMYDGNGANEDLYYTFARDTVSGSSAELYKNLTFISTLIGDATALEIYNNVVYVAIKDDENKGILQRLSAGSIGTIADNDQPFLDVSEIVVNSLYSADSVINVMEVFDNTLFLGLENGEILSFKGSSVSSQHSGFLNIKSVREIRTDGILLYIFFRNTTEMLIMNKNVSGNYIFSTVDTEN